MKFKYKNGIVVGRFQGFHNGHAWIIHNALMACENVYVLVGSAQEMRTKANPFSFEERRRDILDWAYAGRYESPQGHIFVVPLVDIGVGNCPEWGEYVMNTVKAYIGCKPDVFYTGLEEERSDWFTKENGIDIITIPRVLFKYSSGTYVRNALRSGDYDAWCSMVPSSLWGTWELNQKRLESETEIRYIKGEDNTYEF